ncbi:MAG: TonB-dependent receptor, partial [Bacteroidota bacterium]
MQPDSKKLNEVVVTASRPLMRQEDDKTIVDPESLAATSTNAYEILEKVPGLFVDSDGNIYLSSTTPATVYINGREQRMSAADMATLLKNLPPNAIASIEILRTPSARYDASASGGIVNVVLRKGVRIGLTGSVTIGGNQGRYGNQFVGFNLNNNNGSLTTYLSLQAGRRNTYDQLTTVRAFSVDSFLNQEAYTKFASTNYYIGYGLSYGINKKWEISYDGRLSYNLQNNNSSNFSTITKKGTQGILFQNITNVNNKGNNYNLTQGVNVKYKIDSAGSEWTTDLSYTHSPNFVDQFFGTGDGAIDNRLRFFSAQTNFLKKFKHQIIVETGGKTTAVAFNNTTDYFIINNGNRVKNVSRSAAYKYNENIHSGYLQASKNFSGIILKMGTRVENTNMRGRQLQPNDTAFAINRTDFFPYIYLSRSLMKIAGYDLRAYLVYRRTISRPAYENLNPSQRFIDPFLFETGNPNLRPQFTQNYEANVSVDERPIFALGINDTKDIFSQVIYPADSSNKVSLRTYDNLGKNKETYFRILGALPPGKKYFFVAGAQYNHNHYQGVYEGNKPLGFKRGSWSLFTYHQLKLTPITQITMNGFVRFKGQQQFYELGTFGQMNLSFNQQLLNRKLNVTVSYNDIFFTNNNAFIFNQGSINANGQRFSDTRRLGINLRYN